jgi:hypothetical protein
MVANGCSMTTLSDLTPKQRRELLADLRAINKRLDAISDMLDFILKARKIKRPPRKAKR